MTLQEKATLRHILKRVSRSFYLSLIILPRQVREQMCLAYLFCRLADTIADAVCLSQDEKIQALQLFRKQFVMTSPVEEELRQLQQLFLQKNLEKGEGDLFFSFPALFGFFQQLSCIDRQFLQDLVLKLTQGMEMDLMYFGAHTRHLPRALPDLATLDLYIYYVAGVVGEFWTKMHCTHIKSMQHCNMQELCDLGLHFGKGLQLTNILKDLSKDIANGRCYLPYDHLQQLALPLERFHEANMLLSLRPILIQLVQWTLQHLQHAQTYLQCLPLRAIRVRLSCMWPLLFALQTLDTVLQHAHGLLPHTRIKISRLAVYRTMLFSLPCAMSHHLCARYYASLAQHLHRTIAMADVPPSSGIVHQTPHCIGGTVEPQGV